MRSFINFISFGNIYAYVPDGPNVVKNMYNRIFKPTVTLIEEDCGTKLGILESITLGSSSVVPECQEVVTASISPLVGRIDLRGSRDTDVAILADTAVTVTSIASYKRAGTQYIHIRALPTCTSIGGVCRKCLWASYEYVDTSFDPLTQVRPDLSSMPAVGDKVRLDFTKDTSPFVSYIAKSFSGSLLGMRSYVNSRLPLREGLYETTVIKPALMAGFVRAISDENVISAMDLQYASTVQSSLEKVLYLLAQYNFGHPFQG